VKFSFDISRLISRLASVSLGPCLYTRQFARACRQDAGTAEDSVVRSRNIWGCWLSASWNYTGAWRKRIIGCERGPYIRNGTSYNVCSTRLGYLRCVARDGCGIAVQRNRNDGSAETGWPTLPPISESIGAIIGHATTLPNGTVRRLEGLQR